MIDGVIAVIDAAQQGMADIAGGEAPFGLIVQRHRLGGGLVVEFDPEQLVAGRRRGAATLVIGTRYPPAIGIGAAFADMAAAVAEILPQGHVVADVMGEFIADHHLLAAIHVLVRLAVIEIARDLAERGIDHRSHIGQEAAGMGLVLVLVQAQHGQPGAVGCPRDAGRDQPAQILGLIGFPVATRDLAGDAIAGGAILAQRVAQVEAKIGIAPVVDAGFHMAQPLTRRALADQIDHAADIGAAIQGRTRALQHLDPLQREGVDQIAAEAILIQAQPVHEDAGLAGIEAADHHPVGVAVGAELAGADAGGIAQHLIDLVARQVIQLPAADHRHRLRNPGDRRIGLRSGQAAAGHEAIDRAGGAGRLILDRQGRQHLGADSSAAIATPQASPFLPYACPCLPYARQCIRAATVLILAMPAAPSDC